MAIDFFKEKFEEGELRKRYKNYFVPAAKILVGSQERDLAAYYKVQIEQIQVSLNLRDASSASFTVTNIYDLEKRCLRNSVKKVLILGTVLKIKLGYESDLEDVFHGFIYESSMQFGEIPSLQITALDVRRLMLDNWRENCIWKNKSYSQIFEEIMKTYEKLKLSLVLDETEKEEELSKLAQRGNDLDMVQELCQAANKRFIVFGGKAYFTGKSQKDPITTLLWGQELISFSQKPVYIDQEIEVRGNLKQNGEMNVEKRTVTDKNLVNQVCQNRAKTVITLTDIDSVEELKKRADKEEEALKQRLKSGSGSCVGTPVLVPGRNVQIKGLDKDVNGTYYLESVSHSFGNDGFITDFTLGRDESGVYDGVLQKGQKEDAAQKMTGIMLGRVTDNWDDEHPGMVKVELLLGEKEKNDLGWVPVSVPYAGKEFGMYMLPEIGAEVVLGFHMGRLRSPYVIGCLWNKKNILPAETANKENTVKTILTKGGNRILISDEQGKERITILTKGGLSMDFDDENRKIELKDQDGGNCFQLDAKEGVMTFSAKKQAVFKINGQKMLTLDGEASKAAIAADNINAEAGQKLYLKGQNVSLEGSSTDISGQNLKMEAQASLGIKGSASLKAESSGVVELTGNVIKLN